MRIPGLVVLLLPALAAMGGSGPAVPFTENRGQWPAQVLFRANIPGGVLFVEKAAMTYVLTKGGPLAHHGHTEGAHTEEPLRMHAYRVTFEGAQGGTPLGKFRQPHYENFFIGNDPAQWGTGCGVFGEVWVKDVYPGIDLRIDGRSGLKYDWIVAADANASAIRMKYEGQESMKVENGQLIVATSIGRIIEEAPTSWITPGPCVFGDSPEVRSRYLLKGSIVEFRHEGLPKGQPLTIDPSLTFASFTGSTADNFGCTATYDGSGHLYGGGIVFGIGYPTQLGVIQPAFAGATIDMGLTKWTPDGTSLVWSTYLGGSIGNETPHSLVVNDNDELYVLGTCGSSDFPTTAGCFDNSFGGGPAFFFTIGYGYSHPVGNDIVVAHLDNTATALLGSTYMGGSDNDGVNNSTPTAHNYGDHFRGEIALDAMERPVIATCTSSLDAATTPGAPMMAYGGGPSDGYVFRLNPALSTLQFGTYFGGAATDAAYGVQFDSAGSIFVSGGTDSPNLPMAGSPFDNSYNGSVDGWLAKFNTLSSTLVASTFLGTASYDQCYFVQLNLADEVFVVGQTHGAYTVTPGKYSNAGSSQFIHKLTNDLGGSLWSTRIGNGNGTEDISPGAFLVSDCGQIYFSGWGGTVQANAGLIGSTTIGLPVTANAVQPGTDGSDFWLAVLEPEAVALHYATFFGGPISAEHVDGGTSRFDKNGNVYQAVCAGCGGNSDFPTTPTAWSTTNNSFNCNLGVFKMALTQPVAMIDIAGPDYICIPNSAFFDNLSIGGNSYFWDLGDGSTSTLFEPVHTYADTGTYTVMMILDDTTGCTEADTAFLTVIVLDGADALIDPPPPLCQGDTIQLNASGGTTYAWFPNYGLSDTTIANPLCFTDSTITYYVVVTDSCGSDTASVLISFYIPVGGAGPDTLVCLGDSVPITAFGGGTYAWTPAASLNDANAQTPLAAPVDTTQYQVTITTVDGCVLYDSLIVFVQDGLPDPVTNDTATCQGASVQLNVSGGTTYAWQPAPGISALNIPNPTVTPPAPTTYYVTLTNVCGSVPDSVFVDVITVVADAWPDTIICPGESVTITATGGTTYAWSPAASLVDATAASTLATPSSTTTYQVVVSDAFGCDDTAWALVELYPVPSVYAGEDVTIAFGESVQLNAIGNGSLVWSPDTFITCITCASPTVYPPTSTLYTVWLTDENGCKAADAVFISIEGTLYVPNTFTPDGDGINDVFFALGTEIAEFKMYVFNRWGELIYEASAIDRPWDGTYNGTASQIDTYVWRIDYVEMGGDDHRVFGHVNLVR